MRNRLIAISTVTFCLFSSVSSAQGMLPMGGLYVDSFSGVSGRAGFGYAFNDLQEANDTSYSVYADAELGVKASKLSIGAAYVTGYTISRIGVSLAKKDSTEYIGIEAVHSVVLLSFKMGVYEDSVSQSRIFTVGFGIGL